MARDHYPPAFTKDQEVLKYIKSLEDRLKKLEQGTTATLQQIAVVDVDDPIEGEHVIDHTDDQHKWYSNGAWRSGGAFIPTYAKAISSSSFILASGSGGSYLTFPTFNTSNAGIIGFNTGNNIDILLYGPGIYIVAGYVEWVTAGAYARMITMESDVSYYDGGGNTYNTQTPYDLADVTRSVNEAPPAYSGNLIQTRVSSWVVNPVGSERRLRLIAIQESGSNKTIRGTLMAIRLGNPF